MTTSPAQPAPLDFSPRPPHHPPSAVTETPAIRPTRGHGLLEGTLSAWRARIANRLIPPAARSGRILDVGCGTFPTFLANTEFAEKHGIDRLVDPTAAPGLRLQQVDLEHLSRLPFDDAHFDAVTLLAVFEHVRPRLLVPLLAECRRVLKPGGTLILTTPAPWTDGLLRLLARMRLVSREEIDEHKGAYGPVFIRHACHDAGFDLAHVRTGYFQGGLNVWAAAGREP